MHNEFYSMIRDFIVLLKPRVMSLVVFTGIIGLYIAPNHIDPVKALIAILCIALGSGAAGAINMWYDRDIDAIMSRTKHRPIPAGKVKASAALYFGVLLAFASVIAMWLFVNGLSSVLLLFSILFYAVIYTMWLKRSTPYNIVIGGASGAFPPIIGWSAVTNNVAIEPILLFLIIFLWTPPHFWALSIRNCDDYRAAKVPMMPVVKGILHTRKEIFIYSIALVASTYMPYATGMLGNFYFVASTILNSIFLYLAYRLLQDTDVPLRLFRYSITYLFLLFAAVLADSNL